MSVLVVTGTDTGVGKTVVTAAVAALAHGPRVLRRGGEARADRGAPDEPGDLDDVRRLAGVSRPARVRPATPTRCPRPRRRGWRACRRSTSRRRGPDRALAGAHDLVIVEGAGGLLVRYDDEGATLADLARTARRAGAPGRRRPALGTLNHTALTLEAMAHRGLEPGRRRHRGVAGRAGPGRAGATSRDLETLAARPLAGALPEGAGLLDGAVLPRRGPRRPGPALGGGFDAAEFRTSPGTADPARKTETFP